MKEIWKNIEGYPNYQISSMGRVKSLNYKHTDKEKLLKSSKKSGYPFVVLYKDGERKQTFIHRLVASAFIPNTDNKPCIDHINTDRTDNRVENLRWVTYKENMNNPLTIEKKMGENNPKTKPIIQFSKDGEFMQKWHCIVSVERELNIKHSNIIKVINGDRKTAGGFIWGYADDYEQIPFKVFDLEMYEKKVA